MNLLLAIGKRFGGWLAAAGALIVAFFAAYLKGRREGEAIMRGEQEQHRREMRNLKRKIDSETDELAPADLDSQFQRWVRRD